ncbi:MAG: mannose-1-phosphate guanylyltransferase [Gemmatimonadetes bacterium]|nr:mannose-1-phosphate guanylyltransferase [Gemmatimonadota bacterium]MCZ0933860.1 mannose-1-phosphate guanylyltransferase [Candidatus Palauibacter rhopaloidicola]
MAASRPARGGKIPAHAKGGSEDGREALSVHLEAYCAVLAGGIGRRFWPASTPARPKQLLPLAGPEPLIDDTLARAVALVGAPRVRVVAAERLVKLMRPNLDAAGVAALVEPEARGTGPALVWAAAEIERTQPGALMISMHADHRIEPPEALAETLRPALHAARDGYLCCVGVRPDRPETGFGYLETGRDTASGAREVRRFVEKPDPATAREYLKSGRFLWNSGIFVWRAADLLEVARRRARELAGAWPALERGDTEGFFARAEPVAIDVCVMERAERVAVVEARFAWDDLGVWSALLRSREVDDAGNASVGSSRLIDAADNVVWTESCRATVIGVSGLVIVEANGELLVMPREEAAELDARLGRSDPDTPSSEAPR